MNRATWNQNAIFMATRIHIQCAVSRTRVYSNQSFPYSLCLFYNSNRVPRIFGYIKLYCTYICIYKILSEPDAAWSVWWHCDVRASIYSLFRAPSMVTGAENQNTSIPPFEMAMASTCSRFDRGVWLLLCCRYMCIAMHVRALLTPLWAFGVRGIALCCANASLGV